jgi:uncharacterized protein YgbK (DUF1537 family)
LSAWREQIRSADINVIPCSRQDPGRPTTAGPSVRLLADDLTGALDTAAEFVAIAGAIPVYWHDAIPRDLPATAAIDTRTRDVSRPHAEATIAALAPLMIGAGIAYKKIDSLLRGPTLAEIAACARTGLWRHIVLCPAFPFQGRATRSGCQYARDGAGHWSAVTGGLAVELQAFGTEAYQANPGETLRPGIAVFDAETDDDLIRVAQTRGGTDVLWCGSGGLAQALSGGAAASPHLPQPILGLIGSDHAMTAAQLRSCDPHWIVLSETNPSLVSSRLGRHRRALVSLEIPTGVSRTDATVLIRSGFADLLRDLPAPGTLLVAGGETLHGICTALGATHLEVQGRIIPGLPRSILRGGRWEGVTVVSKSGAFGTPALLRDLLEQGTIQ